MSKKDKKVKVNPLLPKIQLPGENIRLPSKGAFYKNNELDESIIDGEVEVFQMKTIDEINLKSPDLIYSGTAIEKVFERCVPSILKPLSLLSEDVDYLLASLRRISYGNALPIKASCECTNNESPRDYTIPINEILMNNTVELDLGTIENDYTFELVDDESNDTKFIEFKPVLFKDLIEIYRLQNESLTNENYVEKTNEYVILHLLSRIDSVEGVTDRKFITEWLDDLNLELIEKIVNKLNTQNEWGVNFEYTVKCVDCEKDIDVSPILNPVSFFTLPSSRIKQS